ncbi:MAG TPA: hypothetical protein VFN21_08510 [Acidimicrobiales bacterium]|nr:hypothetical protein [Acidimicrobiales bacterium]
MGVVVTDVDSDAANDPGLRARVTQLSPTDAMTAFDSIGQLELELIELRGPPIPTTQPDRMWPCPRENDPTFATISKRHQVAGGYGGASLCRCVAVSLCRCVAVSLCRCVAVTLMAFSDLTGSIGLVQPENVRQIDTGAWPPVGTLRRLVQPVRLIAEIFAGTTIDAWMFAIWSGHCGTA